MPIDEKGLVGSVQQSSDTIKIFEKELIAK